MCLAVRKDDSHVCRVCRNVIDRVAICVMLEVELMSGLREIGADRESEKL